MDKEEYIEIFKRLNAHIYNYIFLRVRSREVAEDLTSEVFIKVWINKDKYLKDRSSVKTWIFKIARNHLIDYFKKRRIDTLNEDIEKASIEFNELDDLNLIYIFKKLKELSPMEQDLIIMKHIEELDNNEISRILNKSVNTTKVAVFRAFNKLKNLVNSNL